MHMIIVLRPREMKQRSKYIKKFTEHEVLCQVLSTRKEIPFSKCTSTVKSFEMAKG